MKAIVGAATTSSFTFKPDFTATPQQETSTLGLDKRTRDVAAWQHIVDTQLIEWGRDPQLLRDDGFDPPTRMALSQAAEAIVMLRKLPVDCPTRAVVDGVGGISFEWEGDNEFRSLDFSATGGIMFNTFKNGRLVSSHSLVA